MTKFGSFYGAVTTISDYNVGAGESIGCYKLMTLQSREESIVKFVIKPCTYFVNHVTVKVGDIVVGFYDANAPVPLIYPPQYQAIVVAKVLQGRNVKVDYFDENLLSSDGALKLNIAPYTQKLLQNDQFFTQNVANHDLVVEYGPTTRSIPPQTTPYRIIVICPRPS